MFFFPVPMRLFLFWVFPRAYATASSHILTLDSAFNMGIVIHSYTFLSYLIAHVHAARSGREKVNMASDCCVSVSFFFLFIPGRFFVNSFWFNFIIS